MRHSFSLLLTTFVAVCINVNAQVIPDSLRIDWSLAGYQGSMPDPSLIINVKDFGAYGDGFHDDYDAIMKAIMSATGPRVVFFPSGKYLIKSTIHMPSDVILRGEGVQSNLRFDLSQYHTSTDCINITGKQNTSYDEINSGYYKGSTSLEVKDGSKFIVNSYAEIKESSGDWDPDKTRSYLGQIVKIINVNGNIVDFSPALRITYADDLKPRIRPVNVIENVGLECFKLTRLDPPGKDYSGRNIKITHANNCWVIGVESEYCQSAHIALTASIHISISGCYIHDSYSYSGGGEGYGVFMHTHTCDAKVENSIFARLRHAMIVASGANGNVYAYNYSMDPKSTTEFPFDNVGDLSLHGHYAYANLFEGNIVQNLIVDDYWGASGPYNTFFRNREESYGIQILSQYGHSVKSDQQNLVGNEVTNHSFFKGRYIIQTNNNFTYNNNVQGKIYPPGTDNLIDSSYYLQSRPYFWDISDAWPSIGGSNSLNSGSIPAKKRYWSSSAKTVCLKEPPKKVPIAKTHCITPDPDADDVKVTIGAAEEKRYMHTGDFKNLGH